MQKSEFFRTALTLLLFVLVTSFFIVNIIFFTRLILADINLFLWVKLTYDFSTLYYPIIALTGGTAAVVGSFYLRLERKFYYASAGFIAVAVTFFGVRIYATHIEPYRLQFHEVTIQSDKFTKPLRLLHISDLQSAAIGEYEEMVFERIRQIKPDIILHTGDLLQPVKPASWQSELPKAKALLETLNPPYGVYHVIGDTDAGLGRYIRKEIGGMKILYANSEELEIEGTPVSIYGMTLEQSREGDRKMLEDWLDDRNGNDFTIVMGHSPDYMLTSFELKIDLCLAGHTHGGQVRIPGFGPITTLSKIPREWARGYHKIGDIHFHCSAGIGCEHHSNVTPIRFFCPPEMTLITIRPPKQ